MNPHAYEVNWLSKLANLKDVYVRAKLKALLEANPFAFRKLQKLINEVSQIEAMKEKYDTRTKANSPEWSKT